MLELAISWYVVHGASNYMDVPVCRGTRGHGRGVEKHHNVDHTPACPRCKAF